VKTDPWMVIRDGCQAVGYPAAFEFGTRKQALQALQRLHAQMGFGDFQVMRKSEFEQKLKQIQAESRRLLLLAESILTGTERRKFLECFTNNLTMRGLGIADILHHLVESETETAGFDDLMRREHGRWRKVMPAFVLLAFLLSMHICQTDEMIDELVKRLQSAWV
jgi:hypothetical protein